MIHKVSSRFKYPGCWALGVAFVALTAVELSYVLGGINWLDALAFLLVPAFVLLLIQIILTFNAETKNYCVAFTIFAACLVFCLFRLSSIEFGTVGDTYHVTKLVASSIKNDFSTQFQVFNGPTPSIQIFGSDFVESLWGIFWRWKNWDYAIILLQTLPIVLLWQQLVRFFKKQNITTFPAPLATVVVLTLEMLWAQAGSPYIDSTVGVFVAITLLLSYDFLTPPYERRFSHLAGLTFIAGICLIAKPTGIFVGLLGITVATALGCLHLNTAQKIRLPLIALPSLVYFICHQIQIQMRVGSFFYPFIDPANSLDMANANYAFNNQFYLPYYSGLLFFSWIRDHAAFLKPLFVPLSWLTDYKTDRVITPGPYIRGNGLVFTYFVLPTLTIWLFNHWNIVRTKIWKDPRLSVFAVIFIYYFFFPGSIEVRYALGYNIFILAWCLSYLWQLIEQWHGHKWLKPLPAILICLMLWMSTLSYLDGIRGWRFEPKMFSFVMLQKKIFPHQATPEIRDYIIQQLSQQNSPK